MADLTGQDTARIFQRMFTGGRAAAPPMGTAPVTGVVVSATSTLVHVTVDGFSSTSTFTCRYEPRWAWSGSANVQQIPPRGTVCLMAFPTNGSDHRPWVLSFASWPTA